MPSNKIMGAALITMLLVVAFLSLNAHARPTVNIPLMYSGGGGHIGGGGGGSSTSSNNGGSSTTATTTNNNGDTPSRAELQRFYRNLGALNPGVYNEANQQLYGGNNNGGGNGNNEYSTVHTTYTTVTNTTTVITRTITQVITQTVYVYITYTPHVVGYYLSSIEVLNPPIPNWQFMMPTTVSIKSLVKEPMGYLVTAGLGVDFFIGNATKTVVEKYNPTITYTRSVSTGSGPTSVSTSQSESVQSNTTYLKIPTTIVNNTYINNNKPIWGADYVNWTIYKTGFNPFYYNTTIPEELAAQGYREFTQGIDTGDLYKAYLGGRQWVYNTLKYYYETAWNDLQNWWFNNVANGEYQQWLAHVLSGPAQWLSGVAGLFLGGGASANVPSLQGQVPGPYPPPVSAYGSDWVGINPVTGQPVGSPGSGFLIHPG